MRKGEGEGGEGESVVRNTDEAIIYTHLLLTYTVWSGMGKVKGEGGALFHNVASRVGR